jgi:hypothetical protein
MLGRIWVTPEDRRAQCLQLLPAGNCSNSCRSSAVSRKYSLTLLVQFRSVGQVIFATLFRHYWLATLREFECGVRRCYL